MAVHEHEHGEWLEHARERLRGAGRRDSAGRAAVVELLSEQRCLVTPQEIVDGLRARGEAGRPATVYRALETLHELRLVHRIYAAGIARYEPVDPSGDHHHHLVDESTGEVVPFEDPELEAAIAGIGPRLGLEVTGHDVILRGRSRD